MGEKEDRVTEARTYLDYNATAPLRPQVREAVVAALDVTGNPSSVHAAGRSARRLVEEAREKVAGFAGCKPSEIVFTSGGSEANTLALAPRGPNERLLVSAVEHPSVLSGGRFAASLETIPVDREGVVDLDWLEARLARPPRVSRVSVMAANNETGVIQPIERIAELSHMGDAVMHCDAVQGVERLAAGALAAVDLISLSAHKIGGLHGVGALVVRGDARIAPVLCGGGQERSLRAGTENVAGIVGFGTAAELAVSDVAQARQIARLRASLEDGIRVNCPDAVIFGQGSARIGNTSCFAVAGVAAEKAVIALDLEGVAVSSGAACSSGKVGPSHVLAAMGIEPHVAAGAIRISLGWASSEEDIQRFLVVWRRVCDTLARNRRVEAA